MERNARSAYLTEVAWQCQIAMWSFASLKKEIAKRKESMRAFRELLESKQGVLRGADEENGLATIDRAREQTVRSLMYLQSMLAAVGIISEIFWPNTKWGTRAERRAREARGRYLRDRGKISDGSPLHFAPGGARDTRGGLLHIDEMIDNLIVMAPGERVARFDLGDFREIDGWSATGTVRSLDEESYELTVRARASNLQQLNDEVARVFGSLHTRTNIRVEVAEAVGQVMPRTTLSMGTSDEDLFPDRTSKGRSP
jgi:hypothetical protein